MPRLTERLQDEANDLFQDEEEQSIGTVPLEANDTFSYKKTGYVAMVPSPDGGPGAVPSGGLPEGPGEGLTAESMVCIEDLRSGRAECIHHVALLWPAPGDTKGMERKPLQLRRFCTKLASQSELMELTDTEVYACTARSPKDDQSVGLIRNFEKKQREIAEEAKRTSGKFEL